MQIDKNTDKKTSTLKSLTATVLSLCNLDLKTDFVAQCHIARTTFIIMILCYTFTPCIRYS